MSFVEIYKTSDGEEWHLHALFGNAWRFQMAVWRFLVKKHEVKPPSDWQPPVEFGFTEVFYLWELHNRGELNLTPWEHNVLLFTYDGAEVEYRNFELLAASLEAFGEAEPNSHCGLLAESVRRLTVHNSAIRLHGTTVTEPWWETSPEKRFVVELRGLELEKDDV